MHKPQRSADHICTGLVAAVPAADSARISPVDRPFFAGGKLAFGGACNGAIGSPVVACGRGSGCEPTGAWLADGGAAMPPEGTRRRLSALAPLTKTCFGSTRGALSVGRWTVWSSPCRSTSANFARSCFSSSLRRSCSSLRWAGSDDDPECPNDSPATDAADDGDCCCTATPRKGCKSC
jgi:hypothetical protein